MILQRIFCGIQLCFLYRESHNLLYEGQLNFCVMISHMLKVEWSVLRQTWCVRLFANKKKDNKKKQTPKYLVDCTLNSKFNVQMVNGKSAKCLSQFRNPMSWSYKNSRFPPLSKFPKWLMMDWFYLVDSFPVLTTVIVSLDHLHASSSQWLIL